MEKLALKMQLLLMRRKLIQSLLKLERRHNHHKAVANHPKPSPTKEASSTWRQRTFTTLSVGNGAGLAACWTFLTNNDLTEWHREFLVRALDLFGSGAILAGLAPAFLWYAYAHPFGARLHYPAMIPNEEFDPGLASALWHAVRALFYFIQQHLPHILAMISTTCFFVGIYQLRQLVGGL